MKKIKYLLTAIFTFIIFGLTANAASATVSVKSSNSQVVVGNTITVTVTISSASALGSWEYSLNYDKTLMTFVSSDYSLHYADAAGNSTTKSVSYKYKFKATKSGSAKFYISASEVLDWNEANMSVTNNQTTVKVLTQDELQASYSKDNYLKSLSIDGYSLTPSFNKDTTEYSLTVENDVRTIKVLATKNDTKASLSGTGEENLTEGLNKINVVVTAENGNTKTYVINVTVKELSPIIITYNDIDYTVMRTFEGMTKPATYKETTVTMNEEEIPSLYNEEVDYTLIALKDPDGLSNFFLYYNDGTVQEYNELAIGNLNLYIYDIEEILDRYHKYEEVINDKTYSVLKLNKNSKYMIIYGLNLETNKMNYYTYDSVDKTLQKYYDEEVKLINNDIKDYQLIIYIFGGALFLLLIMFLLTRKKKKVIKKVEEQPKESKEPKKENKKEKNKKKSLDEQLNEM